MGAFIDPRDPTLKCGIDPSAFRPGDVDEIKTQITFTIPSVFPFAGIGLFDKEEIARLYAIGFFSHLIDDVVDKPENIGPIHASLIDAFVELEDRSVDEDSVNTLVNKLISILSPQYDKIKKDSWPLKEQIEYFQKDLSSEQKFFFNSAFVRLILSGVIQTIPITKSSLDMQRYLMAQYKMFLAEANGCKPEMFNNAPFECLVATASSVQSMFSSPFRRGESYFQRSVNEAYDFFLGPLVFLLNNKGEAASGDNFFDNPTLMERIRGYEKLMSYAKSRIDSLSSLSENITDNVFLQIKRMQLKIGIWYIKKRLGRDSGLDGSVLRAIFPRLSKTL